MSSFFPFGVWSFVEPTCQHAICTCRNDSDDEPVEGADVGAPASAPVGARRPFRRLCWRRRHLHDQCTSGRGVSCATGSPATTRAASSRTTRTSTARNSPTSNAPAGPASSAPAPQAASRSGSSTPRRGHSLGRGSSGTTQRQPMTRSNPPTGIIISTRLRSGRRRRRRRRLLPRRLPRLPRHRVHTLRTVPGRCSHVQTRRLG